jgi:hypothetical protein
MIGFLDRFALERHGTSPQLSVLLDTLPDAQSLEKSGMEFRVTWAGLDG